MTTHAMIDIEILGTNPDCVVLSVVAGKQDPFEKMKWAEGVLGSGQLGAVDKNRIPDDATITL